MSIWALVENSSNTIVNMINYEEGDSYTPPTGHVLKECTEDRGVCMMAGTYNPSTDKFVVTAWYQAMLDAEE